MSRSRRAFMRSAAFTGAAATIIANAEPCLNYESVGTLTTTEGRCPYFDQPLMCGGPDGNGRYRCDEFA